eukprot:m.46745 g.46745  ORF g.46745 m.46745 type:complete len:732 (-) comp7286_c0_seq4:379-2574(-)
MEVVSKKERGELEGLVGSNVTSIVKGWYFATLPLNLDNPNMADTITSVITRMMNVTVRRTKTKTRVYIVFSKRFVTVVDRDTLNSLFQFPFYAVEEWVSEDRFKPPAICFTTHSKKLSIDYLHIFQVKKKYVTEMEESLDSARRSEKLHRKSSVKISTLGIKPRIVGTRPGQYLGSRSVNARTGSHICKEVADKLIASGQDSYNVSVIVSTDGLRIAELLTDDIFVDVLVSDISFATVLNEGEPNELLAIIEVDERLDAMNAHVVSCAKQDPDIICQMIGHVQQKQRLKQEALGLQQPFKPELPTPEPVEDDLKDFVINREKLTAVKKLGAGEFGVVWLASYAKQDEEGADDETKAESEMACAVKMLRTESTDQDVECFVGECVNMKKLEHHNIVKLVGICFEARPWLAVLEMMNFGDLRKIVKTCRHKKHTLTYLEQLILLEQACSALQFITEQGFVHMDVAARNILLHTNNVVKISDFGTTSALDPETRKFRLNNKVMKLAVRWMAPETLKGSPILFWEKTDIYSFAVFMWEVFTYGVLPFKKLKAKEARDEIIVGLILSQPDGLSDTTYMHMTQCWEKVPEQRPTFEALHSFLSTELETEREKGEKPRDLGDSVNKLLTQNLRKLSVKASMVRRQSMRVTAQPRARKRSVSALATMPEVDEENAAKEEDKNDDLPSLNENEEWSGTIKRKEQKKRASVSSVTSGPLATSTQNEDIDFSMFELNGGEKK